MRQFSWSFEKARKYREAAFFCICSKVRCSVSLHGVGTLPVNTGVKLAKIVNAASKIVDPKDKKESPRRSR